MNVVVLKGNLSKEVELKVLPTDTVMLKNTIAVKRDTKDINTGEYPTDFINIVVFGYAAEFLAKRANKGDQVCIRGSINVNKYRDKDGKNQYNTNVVVQAAELCYSQASTSNPQKRGTSVQADDEDMPF